MVNRLRSPVVRLVLLGTATAVLLTRPAAWPGHGLEVSIFDNRTWSEEPVQVGVWRDLDISMDGNRSSSREVDYSLRMRGWLLVERPGRFWFQLDSDDGSRLLVDGREVVDNGGVHGRRKRSGAIELKPGEHKIEILYFQGVGDSYLKIYFKNRESGRWEDLPLAHLRPAPETSFDQAAVERAHLLRHLLHVLAVVLILAAGAHLVWVDRRRAVAVFDRSNWQRALARPAAHDLLCVLVALAFYVPSMVDRYPHESYMIGDSPYYANTAISILEDGDFDQRNQTRQSIFLDPQPWTTIGMHDSNIALGRDGAWYPKHPVLMPLVSAPFYALMGGFGLLVYNLVSLLALVVVMRRVARLFASEGAASAACVAVGLTPLFVHFSYSYCADILSSLLLVAGVGLLFARRGFAAGLVLGLSIWAKLPNALGMALAGAVVLAWRDWKLLGRLAAGATLSLGVFAGLNWYRFGAPWLTGYQRVWTIHRGQSTVGDHVGAFNRPFWEGVQLQLFHSRHGLFPTAPAALVALLGLGRLGRRSLAVVVLVSVFTLATFLFYCTYDFVTGSDYSNRFLMPAVALTAIPLACLLDALIGRSHDKPGS